jgi:hypothetical protein
LLPLASGFLRLETGLFFYDYFFLGDYFIAIDSFEARKLSCSIVPPLSNRSNCDVLLLTERREVFLSDSGIRPANPKL